MNCPECGETVPENARYCPHCGAELPVAIAVALTSKVIDFRELIARSTEGFVDRGWLRELEGAGRMPSGSDYLSRRSGCGPLVAVRVGFSEADLP